MTLCYRFTLHVPPYFTVTWHCYTFPLLYHTLLSPWLRAIVPPLFTINVTLVPLFHRTLLSLWHCSTTLYYYCDTGSATVPLFHCCTTLYCHCNTMPLIFTTLYYHYATVPPHFTITVTLCHLKRHCDWLKPNPGPPIANFSLPRCFTLRPRRNLTYDAKVSRVSRRVLWHKNMDWGHHACLDASVCLSLDGTWTGDYGLRIGYKRRTGITKLRTW